MVGRSLGIFEFLAFKKPEPVPPILSSCDCLLVRSSLCWSRRAGWINYDNCITPFIAQPVKRSIIRRLAAILNFPLEAARDAMLLMRRFTVGRTCAEPGMITTMSLINWSNGDSIAEAILFYASTVLRQLLEDTYTLLRISLCDLQLFKVLCLCSIERAVTLERWHVYDDYNKPNIVVP